MSAAARSAASASRTHCRRLPLMLRTTVHSTNRSLATAAPRDWRRHAIQSTDTAGSLLRRFQHTDSPAAAENAVATATSSPPPSEGRAARTPQLRGRPRGATSQPTTTTDVLAEWFPMLSNSSEKDDMRKALDQLNPLTKSRDRDEAAANHKLFLKTSKAVASSFGREQLQKMVQDHIIRKGLPRDLLQKHQRLLEVATMRKDVFVRFLVIEYFGFQDPLAEEKARDAQSEVTQVQKQVPLHVMQLAMSVHARAFGSLLRQHGVKLTSGQMSTSAKEPRAGSDASYMITLEGQQARLDQVVAWMQEVESVAQVISRPLTDLIGVGVEDVQRAGLPSSVQLENIMRRSETLLTVGQEAPYMLSIVAADENGARKAQEMLAKQHIERLRRRERRVLALTAPALPNMRDAELPMYAMQTHLQAHVDDLQLSDDFEAPARLTRQDLSGNRTQVEYDADTATRDADVPMATATQQAVLQTVLSDGAQRVDDLRICEKMLADLEAQKEADADGAATAKTTRNMTVDFGHLLFLRSLTMPLDDKLPEDVSQLSDVLPSPLPDGQWPVAHALGWLHTELRKARRCDMVPQQAPMFVPALPPSATKIEAHMAQQNDARPSPFHSAFGSSVTDGFGSDKDAGTAHDRHDDVRAIIKEMLGAAGAPQSRLFRMLDGQSKFDEYLSLQYANGTDVVQVRMKRGAPVVSGEASNESVQQPRLQSHEEVDFEEEAVQESDVGAEDSTTFAEAAVEGNEDGVEDAEKASLTEENIEKNSRLAEENSEEASPEPPANDADQDTYYNGQDVWRIAGIERVRSVQTDVFVPDAPVDARLMANESSTFASVDEALLDVDAEQRQAWIALMRDLRPHRYSHLLDEDKAASVPQPPSTLRLDGRTYTLIDQHMKARWTWNVVEDPALSPYPVQVHYALSHDLAQARTAASLQMKWDMDDERGRGSGEAADGEDGEEKEKTIWQVVQRQIAPVLTLPYSGGRGYDG